MMEWHHGRDSYLYGYIGTPQWNNEMLSRYVARFAQNNDLWMGMDVDFWEPDREYCKTISLYDREPKWYCLFTVNGQAGFIEFRDTKLDEHDTTFEFRVVHESVLPDVFSRSYLGLPKIALDLLSWPAPTRVAERWRYNHYRLLGTEPTPKVGMGATRYVGSDRTPLVVTAVRSNTVIECQRVHSKMVGGSGQSETQVYEFGSANTVGDPLVLRKSRRAVDQKFHADNGVTIWGEKYAHVIVGYMDQYRDPSF